jgi:hypothetical protein
MNYYAHTITRFYRYDINISKLEQILASGYLLSRRKLGLEDEYVAFNGMDYISLCDLSVLHNDYSAYNIYTRNGLSLLFDKSISVIKPIIIEERIKSILEFSSKMNEIGRGKIRYSDLHDEVQVKDELSLCYLRGVSVSLDKIVELHDIEYAKKYLESIKRKLIEYNYDIPIYDIDCEEEVNIKKL